MCDCLNPKNNTLYTIYMICTQVIINFLFFNKIIQKVYNQNRATQKSNASILLNIHIFSQKKKKKFLLISPNETSRFKFITPI